MLCTAAGLAGTRVDEVLDEVGLADVGDRRVKGFSLGMRQRLGLAAALLGEPEVLILDEPANGLDPEGVHWLRKFLRSYADQGRTVLVSSHLLAEIAQTVDDVVIVAKGRLVTQSSLADLAGRKKPGVWVRTPQARGAPQALGAKGIAAELQTPETVVAFETTTEAVGIAAAGAGVVIFEMTAQHFDLEEFFLDLTTPTLNQPQKERHDEEPHSRRAVEATHNSDDLRPRARCAGSRTHQRMSAIVTAGKSGGGPALAPAEGIRNVMSAAIVGRPHRPDHRHLDHGRGVSPRHGDLNISRVSKAGEGCGRQDCRVSSRRSRHCLEPQRLTLAVAMPWLATNTSMSTSSVATSDWFCLAASPRWQSTGPSASEWDH